MTQLTTPTPAAGGDPIVDLSKAPLPTGKTADIAFTSKALRRIGTLHSVVAFTFNTVVLALTINLLASLF